MQNYTDDQIKIVKAKLRNYSSNFYDNFKTAKLVFEEIEDYTKIDLKNIISIDKVSKSEILSTTSIPLTTLPNGV